MSEVEYGKVYFEGKPVTKNHPSLSLGLVESAYQEEVDKVTLELIEKVREKVEPIVTARSKLFEQNEAITILLKELMVRLDDFLKIKSENAQLERDRATYQLKLAKIRLDVQSGSLPGEPK